SRSARLSAGSWVMRDWPSGRGRDRRQPGFSFECGADGVERGDAVGSGRVQVVVQVAPAGEGKQGVPASAGVFDGPVRLAQDGDDVAGPVLDAAGAEFRDGPAAPDDVLGALLDTGQPERRCWYPA